MNNEKRITNDYYVYIHINKNNDLPFYVGMGRGYRMNSKTGRNNDWKYIVNIFGYYCGKIKENLTFVEANNYERYVIKLFISIGFKLVNKTIGGSGNYGVKKTEEEKIHLSKIKTGKKLPTRTQEHRLNLSKSQTGKKRKPHSDETKLHLSKILSGRKKPKRTTEHTEKLKCFIKGDIPWNKGLKNIYNEDTLKKIREGSGAKRIIVHDKNNKKHYEFVSISEASRVLKVNRILIYRCLIGIKTSKEYDFKYK